MITNLAAITCHFNPAGFDRPLDNYRRFRAGIEAAGVPLYTAELQYGDRPFQIDDAVHFRGGDRQVMFQKERLLNLLIQRLPADVDAVAWIDADVLFQNPDWPAETLERLRQVHTVQLFERVVQELPDGSTHPDRHSSGWAWRHKRDQVHRVNVYHPGYAWAARREWLQAVGLYDRCIVGSGDLMPLRAISPSASRPPARINDTWKRHMRAWVVRAREHTRHSFDVVPGEIHHLWHGSRANRRYASRWQYVRGLNPDRDIELDENGLWRWSSVADARMVAQVGGYFAGRREDDNDWSKDQRRTQSRLRPTSESEALRGVKFTSDWFTRKVSNWTEVLSCLRGHPAQCLEIGSHEGRSALWTLEHVCTHPDSRLTCVDVWANPDAEALFDHNLAPHSDRLTKLKGPSCTVLRTLPFDSFDFIYVDGSHEGRNVLEDAVLSFRLLKPGGHMCFDDYRWHKPYVKFPPRPAVDAFVKLYGPWITVVHRGYQVWVKKKI